MACEVCEDAWPVYSRLIELASDLDQRAILLQCPRCQTLYEVFPEEPGIPRELSIQEARDKFPGAL